MFAAGLWLASLEEKTRNPVLTQLSGAYNPERHLKQQQQHVTSHIMMDFVNHFAESPASWLSSLNPALQQDVADSIDSLAPAPKTFCATVNTPRAELPDILVCAEQLHSFKLSLAPNSPRDGQLTRSLWSLADRRFPSNLD